MNARTRIGAGLLVAALACPALPALAQTPPPPPQGGPAGDAPRPPAAPSMAGPAQSVEGTVDGYNMDPHGRVNSLVLKVGDRLAQFNLPPDMDAQVMAAAPVGQQVTAAGMAERSTGDRTIYRLTRMTGTDGKTLAVAGPGAPGPAVHVEGSVKRLNVSPRGEVDGVVLDTGDFVHTGPEAAAALTVGAKVTADGPARPMADGHQAVEATTVNGTAVRRPPPPHHRPGPDDRGPGEHGPDGDHGPGDDGPPPPPPGQ